jgi:6-phosphogluconolactonase/glucosamine-6-phosphate isomerase/deaminase
MKIEIFADADSVAWQAATLIAAEVPTAVAERDRFIIAVSGVIGITNITQTI